MLSVVTVESALACSAIAPRTGCRGFEAAVDDREVDDGYIADGGPRRRRAAAHANATLWAHYPQYKQHRAPRRGRLYRTGPRDSGHRAPGMGGRDSTSGSQKRHAGRGPHEKQMRQSARDAARGVVAHRNALWLCGLIASWPSTHRHARLASGTMDGK